MLLVSISAIIATGSGEGAIILCESPRAACNVVVWIIYRSIKAIAFFVVPIVVFDALISKNNYDLMAARYGFWIPLITLPQILATCFFEICLREKCYKKIAYLRVMQSSVNSLVKCVGGLAGIGVVGIFVAEGLSRICISLIFLKAYFKRYGFSCPKIVGHDIEIERKRFEKFPRYLMLDQIVNTVSGSIYIPFILNTFGNSEVGLVSLSLSVLNAPITAVSLAIKDVFRQRASQEFRRTGSCRRIYIKSIVLLTAFGAPIFSAIYILAPFSSRLIFGEKWATVGQYIQILAPMFFANFISMSVGAVLLITQRLDISLWWQIFNTAVNLVMLALGCFFWRNLVATLYAMALGRVVVYVVHVILSIRYSKLNELER